jgi:hypothetical protein
MCLHPGIPRVQQPQYRLPWEPRGLLRESFSADHEDSFVEEFVGKNVVVDVESPFVYVGRLHELRDKTLILKNADVHDLRDSTTTREVYVREARVHGIQPNRKTVYVRYEKIVSIALLDDVIP